jgi:hypothetical protein
MMTWNSTSSIAVDWIFGCAPAILLGAICVLLLYSTLTSPYAVWESSAGYSSHTPTETFPLLASTGLLCLSTVFVTMRREKTKPKWLHIGVLSLGVILVVVLLGRSGIAFLQSASGQSMDGLRFSVAVLLPYISISIVAIKHIIMLTRA